MHDVTSSVSHQLAQQGLVATLRSLVDGELARDLEAVEWQVSPEAARSAAQLSPFVSEVVYFAARELLRNAACHGRGDDPARPLRLTVRMEVAGELRLWVEDNGIGIAPGPRGTETGGSGSGLRFHSTMLAAVGGRLEVEPLPAGGTRGGIAVPVGEPDG
jgi:signal transduction histidine kinase